MIRYKSQYTAQAAKELCGKLCEWLEATTQYPDLKEDLDRSWPNYDDSPQWRRFYQYGPVLVADESGILGADGKPPEPKYKVDVCAVCYDNKVQPGDIITSGNGRRYMVRPDGSLRRAS